MADAANKYAHNVNGAYYVDDQCIDCDLCRETAPGFFTRHDDGGHSFVFKQPTTQEEIDQRVPVLQALRERGFRLALNQNALRKPYASWMPLASFIKLDLQTFKPELAGPLVKFASQYANFEMGIEQAQLQKNIHGYLASSDYQNGFFVWVEIEGSSHVIDRFSATGH